MSRVDNRGKPWTQEHLLALEEAFAEGLSLLAISRKLGRSPSACVTKLEGMAVIGRIEDHYHKLGTPWTSIADIKADNEAFAKEFK